MQLLSPKIFLLFLVRHLHLEMVSVVSSWMSHHIISITVVFRKKCS